LTIAIGCASTTTTTTAALPQKEVMLQQAGFKAHMVSTDRQKQLLRALPAGKVSIVKHNGKTFYAYPDAAHSLVYTGNEAQYQTYKQAQLQASQQYRGLNVDPDPHGIRVNEFDGFGPLGGDER
jgi:long-subunit acyl-CoA synthetase (AMP-forming)